MMAHKYYLLHLMFNATMDAAVTMQLISVIVKPQVMGDYLENVQVCTL